MRRTFLTIAVALTAAGLAVGCSEKPAGNDWDVSADTDRDVDEAEPQPDARDTRIPDTGPDTASDIDGDTGGDEVTDGGGDADTSPTDASDASDAAADGDDVPDVADTGGELNRDALPTAFGAGSFISELYVDADSQTRSNRSSGAPRCCFDVQIENTDRDYDAENDNAMAEFLENVGSVAGFGIDEVNNNINQGIREGDLVYLFEYRDWDSSNWQNDGSITMYAHPGRDANSPWDWNQVQMGNGTFEILPDSYDTYGNPKSAFNTASSAPDDNGAALSAEDGTVNLVLDFGQGLSTTFTVERAKLTADIPSNADVTSGGEVAMQNGKLGGAIPKDDLYTGVNRAASSCSCYDMNTNKLIQKQSAETYQCATQSSCSCSGTVGQLETYCSILRQQIASATDVNLNSAQPDNDALSFGASFSAVEATISGVAR